MLTAKIVKIYFHLILRWYKVDQDELKMISYLVIGIFPHFLAF